MSWKDILKARVPSKRGREMQALARRTDKYGIPIYGKRFRFPKFEEFSFKKNYTFDEFYPLLDNNDQRKIMRLLNGAHGLMSETYRQSVMTEKERTALRRRGELPKPFTLDEIKDRISFYVGKEVFEPRFETSRGRLTIRLPLSRTNQEEVVSNALDKLYAKFKENKKHLSKKKLGEKWYQEYRRGGENPLPDYDATEEEKDDFYFNLLFG